MGAAIFLLTLLVACGDTAPSARVVNVTIPGGDQGLTVGQSSDTAVASVDTVTGTVTAEPLGSALGSATISATSTFDSAKSDAVTVTVEDALPPTGTIAGSITVGAEAIAAHMTGLRASGDRFSEFAFEALAGANEVIAWTDENGNAVIDAGDYLGVFPNLVDVIAGDVTSGVDINIDEVIRLSMSPEAVPHPAEHVRWRAALEELARRRAN